MPVSTSAGLLQVLLSFLLALATFHGGPASPPPADAQPEEQRLQLERRPMCWELPQLQEKVLLLTCQVERARACLPVPDPEWERASWGLMGKSYIHVCTCWSFRFCTNAQWILSGFVWGFFEGGGPLKRFCSSQTLVPSLLTRSKKGHVLRRCLCRHLHLGFFIY